MHVRRARRTSRFGRDGVVATAHLACYRVRKAADRTLTRVLAHEHTQGARGTRALVMTVTSTLEPEPRSLSTPAVTALATRAMASSFCTSHYTLELAKQHTSMLARYSLSKMDMAAREPEPMVTNGSLSVDPCG